MQNRVGDHNPSPEAIEALIRTIDGLRAQLEASTVTLTAGERQRVTKFRSGGERIVELITGLATQHGFALPGVPVASLKGDLELARRLQPLHDAVESLSRCLSDTMLQANSECWWGTTAYYSTLVRMASTDAALANALKPAVEFFATGKRKAAPK